MDTTSYLIDYQEVKYRIAPIEKGYLLRGHNEYDLKVLEEEKQGKKVCKTTGFRNLPM